MDAIDGDVVLRLSGGAQGSIVGDSVALLMMAFGVGEEGVGKLGAEYLRDCSRMAALALCPGLQRAKT